MNESQSTQSTADAFRYRLQSGVLLQLDRHSEAIIRVHKPFGNKIVQVEPRASGIIVREDYYQFPRGASNVYLLDYTFRLLWRAELPSLTDSYANPVEDHGDYLQCASWECFTCRICPETGGIISKQFTK